MSDGSKQEVVVSKFDNEDQAISHLTELVKSPMKKEENVEKRVESIIELGQLLSRGKRTQDLCQLIESVGSFFGILGKAKAARMVRDLVDMCLKIDQDGDIKVELVNKSIEWATTQNHVFLRQALTARLIRLFNDLERYAKALQTGYELIRELKKVDNKDLLLEVQLEESRASYFLSSLSKAQASLVSARTIANSIYISPSMQACLDMQSGILHAADDRDFKTALSYFYEAFEGFDLTGNSREAVLALKYMLLCKIMLNSTDDISGLISHKNMIKYHGNGISAMLAVSNAAKTRSLKKFNETVEQYKNELQLDPVVRKHFGTLSENMLEKELCRLIEPYSCAQTSHIASTTGLPVNKIEKKLAQMILDKKIRGSLHQGEGMLIIYDNVLEKGNYEVSVQTIRALGKVIDNLYERAKRIQ